MEHKERLSLRESELASERAAANPGLGELQALREIQMERMIGARVKREFRRW